MIEAIEINRNHFVVKSIDPLGKVYQSVTVYNEGDAIKYAYFVNRLYIIEKMTGWLKQRVHAYQVAGFHKQIELAQDLLGKIEVSSLTSLDHIKRLITENEKTIAFLAPGEKSRQFAYYSTVIRGIVDFCMEMKEVEA